MTERSRPCPFPCGYAAILAVIGLLYLILEWHTTPTLLDDVVYRFQFSATDGVPSEPIRNFGDVLRSQYGHYLTINGRAPAHVLAQTFLALLPAHVLDVLNALLFALMIHLAVRTITPGGKGRNVCAVLFAGSVFVLLRGFQGAMLWQLGTFNYLWPLTLNLLFFLTLRRRSLSIARSWVIFPLALLAGWSHEALSLPLSLGLGVWLIQHRRQTENKWRLPFLLIYMLGTVLCLASPGIWHRAGDAPTLISRIINGTVAVVTNVRILWVLLLTLVVLWRKRRITRALCLCFLPVAVTLLSAYGIVFASGVTLDRVAFHAEWMALLTLLALWWQTVGMRTLRVWGIMMAAASLIFFVPAAAVCRQQVANYRYAVAQMRHPATELIKTRDVRPANWLEQVAKERYVMQFADYGFYSVYMGFDASDSNMRCAARLYGKPRLRFLPADMVDKMEADSLAFDSFGTDEGNRLYAKRLGEGQRVKGVELLLRPEDPATLHFWQRMVAYKGDSYVLDDFHWEVVSVSGRRYVVFTRPVPAVSRRVRRIVLL